jgi:hypothetical protein
MVGQLKLKTAAGKNVAIIPVEKVFMQNKHCNDLFKKS